MTRIPSVITMCPLWRAIRKPARSKALTACWWLTPGNFGTLGFDKHSTDCLASGQLVNHLKVVSDCFRDVCQRSLFGRAL